MLGFATCLLTGCASNIRPEKLKVATDPTTVVLESAAVVKLKSNFNIAYSIPAGTYLPILQDDRGVFYLCGSGIIATITLPNKVRYLQLQGGVFVPAAPSGQASLWIVAEPAAANSKLRDVEEETARESASQCRAVPEPSIYKGARPTAAVTVVGTGPQSVQAIRTNLAGGVVASAVVTAILNAEEGSIVFPDVGGWSAPVVRRP